KLTKTILIDYFAKERLGLTEIVIDKILEGLKNQKGKWLELIQISFLSEEMKTKYVALVESRWNRIFG
ncbi:MAG: type II toxin-antitoxin system HipA family toxin, partial [Cytophagia bacterium]|nr:type II toxin-antitoxin system HipA family toxin [Cytophagia bacterium]